MAELLIGTFVWAAAAGMGMRLLRLAGVRVSAAEKWTLGSALGLGVFAYLVFILGSFGMLARPFWVVLIGAVFVLAVSELGRAWNEAAGVREPFSGTLRLAGIFTFAALLLALCGALAPATGQDELCYHLAQPASYLREGRVYEVPFSTSSLWPYLMEMLFTLGLVLRDESVAKFFHWAMTCTAGGAVYCWIRRLGGGREEGAWGAFTYLAAPAVFIQASFAYVDSALAAYTLIGVLALVVALRESSLGWAVLGGVFTGLAASTKLLGLFTGVLGAAAVFSALRAGQGRRAAASGAVFFAAAALVGGPWYVRAWILRGNPVFPFYSEWFGTGWNDPAYIDSHGRPGLFGFLAFPWDLTMHPAWFGGEVPGPLFLMLVPAAFLLGAPYYARMASVFGLLYAAIWLKIDPNVRFFFPALGFFSVPAGSATAAMISKRGTLAKVVRAAIAAVFASSAALGIYHFHDEALLLARGDRDSYLRRHERSFGVAQAVNARLSAGDCVLSLGEVRGFRFNLRYPFVLEGDFEDFTRYASSAADADAVVRLLRQKGFTHLLHASGAQTESDPLRLASLLGDETTRKRFFEETLVITSGGVRYVLYRILPQIPA